MDNILWENTCYDIDDFYAGNLYQELKMCDKCSEVIEKGGYELCRVNMKPDFWIRKITIHRKCFVEKWVELKLSQKQPDMVVYKGGDREEHYFKHLPTIEIGEELFNLNC